MLCSAKNKGCFWGIFFVEKPLCGDASCVIIILTDDLNEELSMNIEKILALFPRLAWSRPSGLVFHRAEMPKYAPTAAPAPNRKLKNPSVPTAIKIAIMILPTIIESEHIRTNSQLY